MKVTQVLNNNAIMVEDNGVEKVLVGKGLGFGMKKQNIVPKNTNIQKVFVLNEAI